MHDELKIFHHDDGVISIDALQGGAVVGSLVAQMVHNRCRIDSLVVAPAHRGAHMSYELLSQLRCYLMANTEASIIEASISYLEQPLMDQYNYIFAAMDYWFEPQELTMEFAVGDLAKRVCTTVAGATPFSQLPPLQQIQITQALHRDGVANSLHTFPAETCMDLSFARCIGDKVETFLWLTQVREGLYRIGAIHNTKNPASLLRTVMATARNAQQSIPANSRIILEIYSEVIRKIILAITDRKAKTSALTSHFVYYLWNDGGK